jgi:hypothetical protein
VSPFEVSKDILVVKMPTRFMTGKLLESRCGDELHVFGWTWVVSETHWIGQDYETFQQMPDGPIKQVTLVRKSPGEPISPLEAIRTNCYPIERE